MNATERVQQFIGQLVIANATLQEQLEALQIQVQGLMAQIPRANEPPKPDLKLIDGGKKTRLDPDPLDPTGSVSPSTPEDRRPSD